MTPLVVLLLAGGAGLLLLSGKKAAPKATTVANIPTPAGPVTVTTSQPPQTTSTTVPPVSIPAVKVTLPTLPTSADYPAVPASGDLSPMLTQSEQYSLASYGNDQLYNEAMASDHLAFVIAAGAKLAGNGDTRAGDLTLRVANWGK